MDWQEWHDPYEHAGSALAQRLAVIQGFIASWLDETAPSPRVVLSICAGDGRDLLAVLAKRHDRDRIGGVLIELDRELTGRIEEQITKIGLVRLHGRNVDAGLATSYEGAVPADLVILAGVFGNISDRDVHGLIDQLPAMCRPGARVIWTRHRRAPDLTTSIRARLSERSFTEHAFIAPAQEIFSVGVHTYLGPPVNWDPPATLFTFVR